LLGIILSTFLVLIAFVIFIEYKNEKKYQEQRRQKRSTSPKKDEQDKDKQHTTTPTPSLPKANYVEFTHQRLIDMGLTNEESIAFVLELIPQIESQLPLIKASLSKYDYHAIERLTHSIKGSATNIGIGGVSDLLVDYNTYLKTGSGFSIAEAYFKHLIYYTDELKSQYT
jgi:hypothetical protein